jgi:hypothetical protein
MIFPEKMEYNIGSLEILRADTGFRQYSSAKWERSGETWYISKIEKSDFYPENVSDPAVRYPFKGRVYKKLTYEKYEANAKIDPALFQLPALGLIKGARLIRIDYESRTTYSYRNEPIGIQGQEHDTLLEGLERLKLTSVYKQPDKEPKKDSPPKKE